MIVTADVKCYHCGHVSGQVIGAREGPLRTSSFVPRPGYTKEMPRAGERLRCERCGGPVYLEDVSPMTLETTTPAQALGQAARPDQRPRAA